jgi:GNAT superfamily N-acetyltransferase
MNREIIKIEDHMLPEIASCFAQVFAGHPWYEVSKCSACGRFSDTNPDESVNGKYCHDGSFDQVAYPYAETTESVREALGKPDAIGIVVAQLSLFGTLAEIEGFAWGSGQRPLESYQKQYESEELKAVIAQLLVNTNFCFHISEVGLKESARGNGFGKKMVEHLIDKVPSHYGMITLFTRENSPMRFIAEKLGLQAVIGLNSGIEDTERAGRVFFAGIR